MSLKRHAGVLALLLTLGTGIALAAGVDDQIKVRQLEMKTNGEALGTLVKIIRGAVPYDPAVVAAQVKAMQDAVAASDAAKAWDASTQTGATIPTRVKPEIWSQPDAFAAAQKGFADALAALAATTDEAGFKAAFPQLGAACKSCHETFRMAET